MGGLSLFSSVCSKGRDKKKRYQCQRATYRSQSTASRKALKQGSFKVRSVPGQARPQNRGPGVERSPGNSFKKVFLACITHSDLEEAEGRRHHCHAHHHAVSRHLVLWVVAHCDRNQFVERDHDHHPSDDTEENGIDSVAHVLTSSLDNGPGHERSDRFGKTRHEGQREAFKPGARGVVDGQSDAQTLGDVVDGDGDRQSDANRGVGQGTNVASETFGHVVDGDCESSL
mmetsp:Transcript_77300/g.169032  ORF Transcript_77300/g.169032 Transcript_77300/m.169032 type:complete len:229 (-) Transcript_77300:557-1243(-)